MRPTPCSAPAACRRARSPIASLPTGSYEAVTEGKGEAGAFTIRESIAYHREQKVAFRHVTDSRGYSYVQMAEVGGNIGGDYRLFFTSAPFMSRASSQTESHRLSRRALTFGIDVEVPRATDLRAHESVAVPARKVALYAHYAPCTHLRTVSFGVAAHVITVAGVRKTYGADGGRR